jgi:glycosyltransferase involved in cell wall biosynthesis
MKQKLTVIIPCKDERLNIRPCMVSAKLVADELIVSDSGSTDGTLDIIRDVGGARLIERDYINSGNFKNWAIPQATHEWVMILDSDERVTPELADEINTLLTVGPKQDGYEIYRANYFLGHRIRYAGWGADKVLRLFRRDLGRYQGESDHAEVEITTGRVGRLKQRIEHYTYWSYDQYFRKLQRYSVQGAQNKLAAGKHVNFWEMAIAPPLRFLHCYLFRLGFLDGLAGLQISMLTGYSSFAKQLRMWEIEYGRRQPDPEAEHERKLAEAVRDGHRDAA